jgi:polyisoprenoid-binding protein YceI
MRAASRILAKAARAVRAATSSTPGGAMTANTTLTRRIGELEVPAPGQWMIDPVHSHIEFIARHMMISKVRGTFREFVGTITIAEDPTQSSVEATIIAASIETGDPNRDAHLRSPEFLDVERYPEVRYRSRSVRPSENDHWCVDGDLTIRGVTRPVTLEVEFCGVATDPWGNARAGFLGSTEINREDFDITWNQALETGGFLVGKGVKVELDVEAVRSADE